MRQKSAAQASVPGQKHPIYILIMMTIAVTVAIQKFQDLVLVQSHFLPTRFAAMLPSLNSL
jgi:hypothetical protein